MNEASATANPPSTSATCACGAQATDEQLTARLDEVLTEYQGKPGALIPVLQIAQGICEVRKPRLCQEAGNARGTNHRICGQYKRLHDSLTELRASTSSAMLR